MVMFMVGKHTANGTCNATGIGSYTDYGVAMPAVPPLWTAICRAVSLPPSASIDRVCDAYGNAVGHTTIQRIKEGVQPRYASLQKMADAIGVDVDRLITPEAGASRAHRVSHTAFDDPPTLTWEDAMRAEADDLPAEFKMRIPDDALAPDFPRGLEIVWAVRKRPAIGSLVVVRDKHGQQHIRQYAQGSAPGHWIAAAVKPFYSFDSITDGLTVVAVAKWRPMP